MNIIEIALKRTTFKQNPTFEYINNIITDWHDRNLKLLLKLLLLLSKEKNKIKIQKHLKLQ